MPPLRAYIKKSGLALVGLAFVLSLIATVFHLLPNDIQSGIVLFTFDYIKEFVVGVALALLSFAAYKAFKFFKGDGEKKELKKIVPALLVGVVTLVCVAQVFGSFLDNTDCQRYNYTEQLNGGTKIIDGKKYVVNICGSGMNNSRFFGDSMDKVQLTITNEQGEVLAKRRYSVFWDGVPGHNPIELHSDHLIYYDDADQYDSQRTISMPPTIMDRMRAKLSFAN